jgi:hypothetical protein
VTSFIFVADVEAGFSNRIMYCIKADDDVIMNSDIFSQRRLLNDLHDGRASIAILGACSAPSEEAKMY